MADEQRDLVRRLYWETAREAVSLVRPRKDRRDLAAGCDHGIPGGRLSPSRDWARRAYRNLIYFHESIRAGTSPRGNSRSSSRLSCAPRSGRSVKCCHSVSLTLKKVEALHARRLQ